MSLSPRGPGPEPPANLPLLVELLLRLVLPEEEREFILGDLEEATARRARRPGARAWVRELLGAFSLRLGFRRRRHPSPLPRRPTPNPSGRGGIMFRDLLLDLRYAFRTLLRSPGFFLVSVATMALGIGANTAVFSILNGVVLKPLPYPEAHRLVLLQESNPSEGWETFSISPANYLDWEERNQSMARMAAYQRISTNYTGGDRPQSVAGYRATEDFLPLLGGEPTRGRGLTEEDLDPDSPPVVILTYGFWQRSFGGDPAVLGRAILLDDVPHRIVGILQESWRPLARTGTDVILPLRPLPWWATNRGSHYLYALGRLAEGVTLEAARSELAGIARVLEEEYPDSNTGWTTRITTLEEVILGSSRPQLLVFMASVGLILLIACANLANMTLARGTLRSRELAIRMAVGAGRARVLRQLLAESLAVALVGGAVGSFLAFLCVRAFLAGWPTMLPRMGEIAMDLPVLLFSLGLVVLAAVLFGLAPAWQAARSDVQESLRQGGRSIAGDRSRRWMRSALVVTEMGLAVVLLVGTGLLLRSFTALRAQDPGFATEDRLYLMVPLSRTRYEEDAQVRTFVEEATERLAAVPGVESVALTSLMPLEGSDQIWGYWIEGQTTPDGQENGSALYYRVSAGYFETMGIPLLAGRPVGEEDRPDGPPVVVVSESFARRHFPGESPLGRRIRFGRDGDEPWVEIVGMVGEVRHYELAEASIPQIYVPFQQNPTGFLNYVVATSLQPSSLAAGVRGAIEGLDPDQTVVGVRPVEAMVAESIAMPRFRTLLMSGFGATALLLAIIGLYGVMACSVSQRRKEIGVRMALGASRGSVLAMVVREGSPLVVKGLVLGLAGALVLSRLLESMLFQIGARDPGVFLGVPLLLSLVALAAMTVPARRATRVDPVRALGEE